jgi:hypothetical protein
MTKFFFSNETISLKVEDLPALSGSEKQISWAESIRSGTISEQIIGKFDRLRQRGMANGSDQATIDAGMAKAVDQLNAGVAKLIDRETSAKFWIDNRNFDIMLAARG